MRAIVGYTLIEMAIALTVVGIMMASFARAYNLYLTTQQQQLTENNATAVIGAINNYLIQTGAYPCPARLDARRSDVDYGIAGQCDSTQGNYVALASGTYSNGYCEEISDRLPALANPLVRRGMVPFRTLGVEEDFAEDGYGMRYQYAVTEALTVPSTYNILNGGIDVVNEKYVGAGIPIPGTSWIAPPSGTTGGAGHFVLFSSGPDRAGGYSRDGLRISACANSTLDAENCNTSALNNYAIYRLAPYSTAVGGTHFDDMVKYFSTVETPLWKISDSSGYHITDLLNTGTGKVGIGIQNPSEALEVAGTVHAAQNLHAVQLCPAGSSASGCFPVANAASCPPGQYATAIGPGVSSVTCTSAPQVTCPSGQLMVGINPQDKLLCSTDTNCPVSNQTMCGIAVQIPASVDGTVWTSPVEGFSYQETWQCQKGGWSKTSSTGGCTNCSPGTASYSERCDYAEGTGTGTWTGNATVNTTTVCPSGVVYAYADTSHCTCAPTAQSQTVPCPPGFTGGPLAQTRNWTCSSNNVGAFSPWTTTSGTCTCDPTQKQTQTLSCPAGYSGGGITQTSTFQCASGVWGPWLTTSDTCACMSPPAVQYQTIGCKAPLVGTQNQSSTFDCTSNSWGPWTTYQDNCGAVTYSWQAISNRKGPYPSPLSIRLGNTCSTSGSTGSCSSAAGGGQYWHYDTCQCE